MGQRTSTLSQSCPPEDSQSQADTNGYREDRLSSQVRHDLRTCLNQIFGYCELLIDDAEAHGWQEAVPDLNRIYTAGKNLLTLINAHIDPVGHSRESPDHSAETATLPTLPRADRSVSGSSSFQPATGMLLIVDDNPASCDLLTRSLERQGYTVSLATTGQQALEQVRAQPFDLILLDVVLPEKNGYEVLQDLKADPSLQHIPVVMISALGEIASVVRCIQAGAEDYLSKPFNRVLLQARIGACLEKKRLRDREIQLFEQLQENYRLLQEMERLRDDLTQMIVHDLRTPLTSLLTGLQTLTAEDLNATDQEFLGMAIGGGETLLRMINDLLDIHHMEVGSPALECEEMEATVIVDDAIRQVAALAAEKALTLSTESAPGLPRFFGDQEKLQRTLVNLLGNAIKFTPAAGRIDVSVRREEGEEALLFTVRDTGEGIPKEAFQRIFDKFGQVETRKAGRKMSTGLGLTFCKMVVEAHGGRIWVESEPGQGSTFLFTIPLLQTHPGTL